MTDRIKYLLGLLLLLIAVGCAQVNTLQGGAKDTRSPRFDTLKSFPKNGAINVRTDVIELRFDEYIRLNNPKDNIIITPSMAVDPEISSRNKKLRIELGEPLQQNTTYTITFNGAVTDITEKNDSVFQYVFSTGDYIDSLSLTGEVKDGFTNRAKEAFLVALYPSDLEIQPDSIPFLEKPLYLAQTKKNGRFQLNYLKEGEYYLFAFMDANKNLKLDADEERAFVGDQPVMVNDSSETQELRSFTPEIVASKILEKRYTYPGKLELIWTSAPSDLSVETEIELLQEQTGDEDSLVFWLSSFKGNLSFILNYGEERDTIKPLMKNSPENADPIYPAVTNNLVQGKVLPYDSLRLTFGEPIDSWDTSKVHFYTLDTVELSKPVGFVRNVRTLVFDSIPEKEYLVQLDTGMLRSVYGNENAETWVKVEMLLPTYFGTLILNTDTTFENGVMELTNDQGEVVATKTFEQKLIFENLIPGDYQIRVIMDENGDGKWTSGDIQQNQQPEKVLYNTETISIKSKWEKEVDWIIQNKSNGQN